MYDNEIYFWDQWIQENETDDYSNFRNHIYIYKYCVISNPVKFLLFYITYAFFSNDYCVQCQNMCFRFGLWQARRDNPPSFCRTGKLRYWCELGQWRWADRSHQPPTWPGSSCRRFRSSGWRQANQVKALERLLIYIWSNSLREIYKSHAKKVLIEGTKYLPSFHLVKFPPLPCPTTLFLTWGVGTTYICAHCIYINITKNTHLHNHIHINV